MAFKIALLVISKKKTILVYILNLRTLEAKDSFSFTVIITCEVNKLTLSLTLSCAMTSFYQETSSRSKAISTSIPVSVFWQITNMSKAGCYHIIFSQVSFIAFCFCRRDSTMFLGYIFQLIFLLSNLLNVRSTNIPIVSLKITGFN